MIAGEIAGDAVGPFDKRDAIHTEELVQAEISELVGTPQTVGIAMPDDDPRGVLVNQRKGRAVNRLRRCSERRTHGLHKTGLACAEIADECNDIARLNARGETRRSGDGRGDIAPSLSQIKG